MATPAAPEVTYPCVPYELGPEDFGYEKGRRYKIQQFDGEEYTFRDRAQMDRFVNIHGFRYVKEDEMNKARAAYDSLKEDR